MDGNFIIPNGLNFTLENCRNPKACPAIPEPPTENNLKAEPDDITITDGVPQDTLEHTIFEFSCKEEFTLAGVIHDTVENLKVKIPCRISNGSLVIPDEWPSCLPVAELCSDIPSEFENSITNVTSLSVAKDETVTFTCIDQGKSYFKRRLYFAGRSVIQ